MKLKIIKMQFHGAVHFGNGGLNTTASTFHADTLFSALCKEAAADDVSTLEKLFNLCQSGKILFSDSFPYIGDTFYVPKPMIELKIDREGDSVQKKQLKKLQYVPIDQMDSFLNGKMNIGQEEEKFNDGFGQTIYLEKTAVEGLPQANPWGIAAFRFQADCGLYFIVQYEEEDDLMFILDLLDYLQYTGIGGKTSSGMGKFNAAPVPSKNIPVSFTQRILGKDYSAYMLLCGALPSDDELENVISNASYRIDKRGGFISSSSFAESSRKKKDLYIFRSGSTFGQRFGGTIPDVSDGGNHPVYRYAKALFMGVR